MKKLGKSIVAGLLSVTTLHSIAGETWRKETYESGESVYYSNNSLGLVTSIRMLIGERGVGFIYLSGGSASFSRKFCFISTDGMPEVMCEIDFSGWPLIKTPINLANQIAASKSAKLRLRVCDPAAHCNFANDAGDTKEFVWEWDEPLSVTYPDFKPYPLER